jgi:hypothetical protein
MINAIATSMPAPVPLVVPGCADSSYSLVWIHVQSREPGRLQRFAHHDPPISSAFTPLHVPFVPDLTERIPSLQAYVDNAAILGAYVQVALIESRAACAAVCARTLLSYWNALRRQRRSHRPMKIGMELVSSQPHPRT